MDTNDMIDLGRSYDTPSEATKSVPSKVDYPSLYLSGVKQDMGLPDGEFYAVVVMKKRSSSMNEDETGRKTYSCSLDVLAIKPIGGVEDDAEEAGEPVQSAAASIIEEMKEMMAKGVV